MKSDTGYWDVIIIGAGIGGCSAGALLADAGKRVLVLEKGEIGGRCRSFNYEGYTLDLGGHLLEDGALTKVYEKLGKELRLGPPTEPVRLWMGDKWIDPRELLKDVRADLRKISEEILSMSWDDLEELDDVPLTDWVRARTKSEGIMELFGIIGVLEFNVFTYDDIAASEFLALRKLFLQERGMIAWSQYPIGGCIALVQPLADVIREKGGEVRTHAPVREVVIEDGVVRGVEVEEPKVLPNEYAPGIRIEAPVVICTLPAWDLLTVLPKDKVPQWYQDKVNYIGDHRDCFFGFYAGSDKSIMGLTIYSSLKLPRTQLPGGALEPSAYDPGLAPEGRHLILCGCSCAERADWLHDKDWLKVKTKEFEADMEEVFPDLKEHCLWKRWHVVDNFALLQKPGFVGSVRPGFEIPGGKGLYLVSDTANVRGRGMGMDATTRAAMNVVERILGKRFPEFADVVH